MSSARSESRMRVITSGFSPFFTRAPFLASSSTDITLCFTLHRVAHFAVSSRPFVMRPQSSSLMSQPRMLAR